MEFLMRRQWSMMERFDITDPEGALAFEARGHLGASITLHDAAGRQAASVTKHLFSEVHEVEVDGQQVAQVRHTGFFGDRYEVESSYGVLSAQGRLMSGDLSLARNGQVVAQMARQFSFREKFAVDVADSENPAFILAVLLAIEAIHDERENNRR
jgi:uncharacterized protein YxjI